MTKEDAPSGERTEPSGPTAEPSGARGEPSADVRCPRCGERSPVRIVYGYPMGDMIEASERGEIVLGGCMMSPQSPSWHCRRCGREWADEGGLSFEGAAGIWIGADAPARCQVCGRPLGSDPEAQLSDEGGLPLCGDCYRAREFDADIGIG